MGCNYYVRKNICPLCKRYDEVHIGKSSVGWQFTFQGYHKGELDEIGLKKEIKSFADWKKILKKERIFNEYDEEISHKDFIELIESKKMEKFNHTTYCRSSGDVGTREHGEECWLDREGYSFQYDYFS